MSEAEATVRSQLLDAIASTADQTRLTAGQPIEALLDALIQNIRAPETQWAFTELAGDA